MKRLPDPVTIGSTLVSRLERFGPPGALFVAVAGFTLLAMRQTFTVPGSFGLSLAATLFALGGTVWLGAWLTGHVRPARPRVVMIAVLAYVLASFISYSAAMARSVDGVAISAMDRYVMIDLSLVGTMMLLIAVIRTPQALRIVVSGLVLGGSLSALFALVHVATGLDLAAQFRLPGLKANDFVLVQNLMRNGINRPQGAAGHPLELSALLTILLPLAVALFLEARRRGAVSARLWFVCTLILMGGALVTVSRSAVVGTAAAIAVMCWRWPVQRLTGLLVVGTTVVGVGVAFNLKYITAMIETFAGSAQDSSIHSRQNGLDYAAAHFWEHPWVGQGVGAYPALKQPVLDNQYLSRLMEAGVLGFVTFCAVLAVGLVLAIRSSAARDQTVAELGGGISGALAAMAVISLILDTAGFVQAWYLTWILVTLGAIAYQLRRDAVEPGAAVPQVGGARVRVGATR